MNWKAELEKFFKEHEEEGVALLKELVSKNTVNPPGNEYLVADVLKKYFDELKIPYETFEKTPKRTNLIAKVGEGHPVLFVPCHADVVPVNPDWDHDPFTVKIENGTAYGRGVGDDKGPMVSAFLLAKFLKQHEGEFKGTFLFASVADEEVGSTDGLVWLTETGKIKADYAVVPDTGSGIYKLSYGEKGLLRFQYTFRGKAGHAAYPDHGINSIWPAVAFLNSVKESYTEKIGFLKEKDQPNFSPTTFTVSGLEAGGAYNIIPKECKVRMDIRYTPQRNLEEIKAWTDGLAKAACEQYPGTSFTVEMPDHMTAFEIDPEGKLCKAAMKATKDLTGKDAVLFGMNGTTVCKQLLTAGIPSLGYSQDDDGSAHQTGEHIKLSEIPLFGIALGLLFAELAD